MGGRWLLVLSMVLVPLLTLPERSEGRGAAAAEAPDTRPGSLLKEMERTPSSSRAKPDKPCRFLKEGKTIVRMVKWRKDLTKREHEKYRRRLPAIDLDIGMRIAKGCSGGEALEIAETYLRSARKGARENVLFLLEAEANHRLGFVLLKRGRENLQAAFNELVKAHRLYSQYGEMARAAGKPAPALLGVNLSQVSLSLGNIASTTAKGGVPGDAAYGLADTGPLSLYRIRKNIAKQFYLDAVAFWPSPAKNPEAYFRASRMLIYFASDIGNLELAEKYLSELRGVIDGRECRLPPGEKKREWKRQIDHELVKVRNRLRDWATLSMEIRY